MSRPMSPEFIKAWKDFEEANALAADSCPAEIGAGGSILRCGCPCHEES